MHAFNQPFIEGSQEKHRNCKQNMQLNMTRAENIIYNFRYLFFHSFGKNGRLLQFNIIILF